MDGEVEQALKLLLEISLGLVRDSRPDEFPDFTLRQLAIMLTIYLDRQPHSVRDLARKLGVVKPVITRALDAMEKRSIVTRARDRKDRRNVVIERTVKGDLTVESIGELVRAKSRPEEA